MFKIFCIKQVVGPTKKELLAGLFCWLAWQFVLPILLLPLPKLLGLTEDVQRAEFVYQIAFFTTSCIMILVVFRRFLWRSYGPVRGRPRALFFAALRGFGVYYILAYLVTLIILLIPVAPDNRNNEQIVSLLEQNVWAMGLCTVVFGPITEEVLVRGIIFAPLCKKSPLLAYAVSITVFSGLHIAAYIGQQPPLTLLISFLQYLPAGIALGWTYQQTGSLWSCIAVHALTNSFAMLSVL